MEIPRQDAASVSLVVPCEPAQCQRAGMAIWYQLRAADSLLVRGMHPA